MRIPRIRLCRHRFELTGLNLERFINMMHKDGIPLLRVRRQNQRTLLCECYSGDLGKISAVAGEKGWRLQNIRALGLSALWSGMKKRPGIPAGIILSLVTVMVLSQFVWRIEIHNAGAYEADIAAYLSQNGCKAGSYRKNVDARALERALTYRYPELAWFHVYVSNVTLVVDVTHGAVMPSLPTDEQADIVALRDGIVDSIRVFAGTPKVKPGDSVRKGQLLIKGEERGSDGQIVPARAEGAVMARCWMTKAVRMPLFEIISTETGREVRQSRLCTPWFSIPDLWEEPAYLAVNTYLIETPLVGCYFPIVRQMVIHREVALEYASKDVYAARKEAGEAALKLLANALHGYEIIDKWVDYCMIEDESLSASATAEWLMDIGVISSP